MLIRIVRYVCWGIVVGLAPLVAACAMRKYDSLPLRDVLSGGQGFLLSVAWIGTALRELWLAPASRTLIRDLLVFSAFVTAVLASVAYGNVSAHLLNGQGASSDQLHLIVVGSVGTMVASALIASVAVAVGTPEPT